MEYHHFYFAPIPYDTVIEAFENRFDEPLLEAAYALWGIQFIRKYERFCHHQTVYHAQLLEKKFKRKHDLSASVDTWSINDQLRFSAYLDRYGYSDRLRFMTYHVETIQRELEAQIGVGYDRDVSIPPGLTTEITRLWFNQIIDNPPTIQSDLLAMDYTKEYLKTKHWRRIRALKLLIHENRCSSSTCYKYNSFHFGEWTKELHVHHLTYENRGNERYDDVCLLCRTCHEAITGNPELKTELRDNLKLHTRLFTHTH